MKFLFLFLNKFRLVYVLFFSVMTTQNSEIVNAYNMRFKFLSFCFVLFCLVPPVKLMHQQ